jgi:predicted MPP superfamily phosphohydrolase
MLDTATTLPEPPAPSNWPWIEVGKLRRLGRPRYELPIDGLPEALRGLRILHISDIHIDRTWMPAWDELHNWIAQSPPDLICITGDWVDKKHDHRPALPLLERFLSGLKARLGIWGILGNHDTDLLPLRAGKMPVRVLYNQVEILEHAGSRLEIIGLHGVHPMDVSETVLTKLIDTTTVAATPASPISAQLQTGDARDTTKKPVRIVLSHYPAHAPSLAEAGVDLVLAGHTHGGQVCLPGGVPILTHDRLPRRFARGAHRIGKTWLITSRGCGFSKYPVRIFCPAEVIEIVLTNRDACDT